MVKVVLLLLSQTMIVKQWHGLQTQDKRVIRETIVKFLVETNAKIPSFVRNKLAKLNVDIARHDWPHFYHDFLTNIIQVS